MVAFLTSSCLTIGSHCNCLRIGVIGVTWSNFLVPETIRAAKFCTVCNSSMFFLVLLAHTDEQYNNLLNTRELIIVINVRLSNRYFTRFIFYLSGIRGPTFTISLQVIFKLGLLFRSKNSFFWVQHQVCNYWGRCRCSPMISVLEVTRAKQIITHAGRSGSCTLFACMYHQHKACSGIVLQIFANRHSGWKKEMVVESSLVVHHNLGPKCLTPNSYIPQIAFDPLGNSRTSDTLSLLCQPLST